MRKFLGVLVLMIVVGLYGSDACQGRLLNIGVTEQDKVDILLKHNQLRQRVAQGRVSGQPAAQNMMEMVWDDELAAKAQQWANQCIFEHDDDRELNRFTMGQNLALMWSDGPLEDHGDFPSRIQTWFNEVSIYPWGSSFSTKTGHYSQLVWGDTNLVGCGYSYYYDYKNQYNKLWVCNYGPGGNVIGLPPYTTGNPACYNHGLAASSNYPGLCTFQTGYNTQENIIPDTNYYQNTYNQGSVNKYKAPFSTTFITVPEKATDYTFKSFGFNNKGYKSIFDQAVQKQVQPTLPPPKTSQFQFTKQTTQQKTDKHSAYYTYNWDSLFNYYNRYNTVTK